MIVTLEVTTNDESVNDLTLNLDLLSPCNDPITVTQDA